MAQLIIGEAERTRGLALVPAMFPQGMGQNSPLMRVDRGTQILDAVETGRGPCHRRSAGCSAGVPIWSLGFGAGTLISAISYELIFEAVQMARKTGYPAFGFFVGAFTFYFADLLIGGGAANGATINDALYELFRGLGGNDTIDGGAGVDWLIGDAGNDNLAGWGDAEVVCACNAPAPPREMAAKSITLRVSNE